ncbi:cth-2 [Pristionchus pacificus]|uniref:cystathionine gamma-lyase n=1 Tax=Pristionchus pacificus TaxID=54126 RepID=A0A2A6B752_PRIPA|nr:cth-2 [Pristionchus pacificus]|eukprot:PDM61698.1 cth-2 [Pristionchus pacificus]
MSTFPGFGTNAVHVGQEPEQWEMNQVVPLISLSTTYKQDAPGQPKAHDYSRAGNPTRDVLQANLAALEDAKYCFTFGSGLASSSAIVNKLKTGDHVICSDDVYGGTQRFLRKVSIPHHGLEASFVDLTKQGEIEKAFKPNTKMVWFESPSNPLLKVVDIQAVVAAARKANPDIIVVVDNTFMSPYFQRPLSLGADVVVHSITKYINGHSDVVMGCVMTDREDIKDHLFFQQLAVGAVPSPFDCFLVNRGIKTLHLRMKAHYENALAVAQYLEKNERVEKVLYPALPSHPQHEVHRKQTKGMSGMMSFYLKGGLEESQRFFKAVKVFTLAESLGGYESLAELPSVMTHASVPEEDRAKLGITDNLIRLSVGIEDKDDLIADLENALKAAVPSI